jgi:D-aminopeptidase
VFVGNAFGKLAGSTQVDELGTLETPIVLTNTLGVGAAVEGVVRWTLAQPGNANVRSVNALVGETNDSGLNDIRGLHVRPDHVVQAIENARTGAVDEGSVGAGTGTQAFGWKGGIGTSSRVLPETLGGYTIGVLVQTNYGGVLTMNGAPVGRELEDYSYRTDLDDSSAEAHPDDGSIMMVVATDAPLTARSLDRLAMRAIMGLARTGSFASNGSGDYVIAFSTHPDVRRPRGSDAPVVTPSLTNEAMSPLFAATAEATEEAIYNAILKATTVESSRGRMEAIPLDEVKRILKKYNVLNWDQALSPRR